MDPITLIVVMSAGLGVGVSAMEARSLYVDWRRDSIEWVLFPPGVATTLRERAGVKTLSHLELFRREDLFRLGLTSDQIDMVQESLSESGRSLASGELTLP